VTYRGSAFHRDKEYRIAVARLLFPLIRLSEVSRNALSCSSGGPACSARAARAGLVPVTSRIDALAWSHGKAWPHGKDWVGASSVAVSVLILTRLDREFEAVLVNASPD
jgi:hypothetical protein